MSPSSHRIDLPEPVDEPAGDLVVFVIGGKDTVVPADENLAWIKNNVHFNYVLKWHNEMEHRVDINTFKTEIKAFYNLMFPYF